MSKLEYRVTRRDGAGTVLKPHAYADGCFVVSKTRFAADQLRVREEAELAQWVAKGFGVRMSNAKVASHRAPSLITAAQLAASC